MQPGELEQLRDRSYGGRMLLLSLAGAAGAMLLTWFMHELIHSSHHELDETKRAHLVDFVRLQREESSVRKDRLPARPSALEAPPAPATPQAEYRQSETILEVSETVMLDDLGSEIQIGGLGFDSSDGEYLPIVKIAPIYPQRALIKGIEGECVVMYTVTASGSTRDVVVVENMCTDRVFHKSSIAAAKKFKYKPRIIDGEAVEVHRVTNRFIYEVAYQTDEKK
jgi:protein TonB